MTKNIWRSIIHGTVYLKRAQGWVGMATFAMMVRLTVADLGLDLTWWQVALGTAGLLAAMAGFGWLEFRWRSVDIEQELWAKHTPTLRRIEAAAGRGTE